MPTDCIMDKSNVKNKKLLIPETGRLETVTDEYPDVPVGGMVVKVTHIKL